MKIIMCVLASLSLSSCAALECGKSTVGAAADAVKACFADTTEAK